MQNYNIEIKARCHNLDRIRKLLCSMNTEYRGLDHQVDTYFRVNHGRLKTREGSIESALIQYHRNDQKEAKKSKYRLYKSKAIKNLKEVLKDALGILSIVDKKREIYYIKNAKFHLDKVEYLGTFVEIEIIQMGTENDPEFESLQNQCDYYIRKFGITKEDMITNSYSDMVSGLP